MTKKKNAPRDDVTNGEESEERSDATSHSGGYAWPPTHFTTDEASEVEYGAEDIIASAWLIPEGCYGDNPELLIDEVPEERWTELAAGADPTDEELEIWEKAHRKWVLGGEPEAVDLIRAEDSTGGVCYLVACRIDYGFLSWVDGPYATFDDADGCCDHSEWEWMSLEYSDENLPTP